MTHITMLTQPGNTGLWFADVRVRLRLLNVADSAVRVRVIVRLNFADVRVRLRLLNVAESAVSLRVLAVKSLGAHPHDSSIHAVSAWKYQTLFC